MLTEALVIGGGYYLYNHWEEIHIRKKWNQIVKSGGWFTNKLGKTLKIWKYQNTEYGYDLTIELPYSYTADDLHKDESIFKEGLKLENIEITARGNICTLKCVKNRRFSEFKPLTLPPHVLYIAEGLEGPITVDMNKFPHALIGGSTGTGKSRLLFTILTNLIATTDQAEIYMLQVRKNDLEVFENCKQVKTSAKSLKDIRDILRDIDQECNRREQLIKPTLGFYNIADYNQANTPLKYIYTVIEEFSFLQKNGGDSKEEEKLKKECLKYIKTIVNVGRSSGVFLITALQKPTADSIPSDIKAQLTTRVSLKITDAPASIVVLGNDRATELKERQLIIKTLEEELATSYTINHEIIMRNIKPKIIQKQPIKIKEKKRAAIFCETD